MAITSLALPENPSIDDLWRQFDIWKAAAERALVWVDRKGHETSIDAEPRPYVYPRLSPDGTRVAMTDARCSTLAPFGNSGGSLNGDTDAVPFW